MSFIDQILDVGSDVWDWATGGSTSAGIARAAALAYMLKEVQSSINRDNDRGTTADGRPVGNNGVQGTRTQLDPSTDTNIPVVYGQAYIGGRVVDAQMSEDAKTMWFALVLCEKTGPLLSSSAPSVISINDVYWNGAKIEFKPDGVTANILIDDAGNASADIGGLVKVWAYSGNSSSPTRIAGYGNAQLLPAFQRMPGWTSAHNMPDCVFVIVEVTYSAEKFITGLGDLKFRVNNTMRMPGDCIFDYMTNTRYGAGINPAEINS